MGWVVSKADSWSRAMLSLCAACLLLLPGLGVAQGSLLHALRLLSRSLPRGELRQPAIVFKELAALCKLAHVRQLCIHHTSMVYGLENVWRSATASCTESNAATSDIGMRLPLAEAPSLRL